MASANSPMTLYQCSECEHCSTTLDDATIHAYEAHQPAVKDESETHFVGFEELDDEVDEDPFLRKKLKHDKNDLDLEFDFQPSSHQKNNNASSIYLADAVSLNLKRADMWQQENIRQLIDCVKENFPDLKNRMLKKKHIWEKIRNVIAASMPGITRRQCEQKWRNMLSSQRKYMVSSKVSKSRMKKPDFFADIAALVGDDIYKLGETTSDSDPLCVTPIDNDSHNILLAPDEDEPLKLSAFEISDDSTDNTSLLLKILNTLEKRELSRNVFQRQIIELEKAKLQSMRKFLELKEQQNMEKIEILKIFLSSPTNKRSREE